MKRHGIAAGICILVFALMFLAGPRTAEETHAARALNGVCRSSNGNWYYYKDGQIRRTNTVAKNKNGWWVIRNGKVDFKYNGFARNQNGWWYCKGGKVMFGTNSVVKGTVNGTKAWWHVVKGKVVFDNTVAKNSKGWWHIQNGKVNFKSNTVAKNSKGWWHIQNGKVNFKSNTVAKNSKGWWYIKNGKVDFSYNGIGTNKNGSWMCRNGKVNFSYSGSYMQNGYSYTIKNGKVTKKQSAASVPHTHIYDKGAGNFEIKNGIACNTCYKDLTDWADPMDCHLGWHTHTWYLYPSTTKCKICGQKIHAHNWSWIKPQYYPGTDDIATGGYYHCYGCGADSENAAKGTMTDIDKWTTAYDFTGKGYLLLNEHVDDKGNVWELERLHLYPDKTSIPVGQTATVSVKYAPASTNTSKTLTWTSSNPSVATVKNGVVTALSPGKTTVTAKAKNGVSSSVSFTVTDKSHAVTDFSIKVDGADQTDQTITVKMNQRYSLQIVPKGSDAPQYTAQFHEIGYAVFYHGSTTREGIFTIANYDTGSKIGTIDLSWDGTLDMVFDAIPKSGEPAEVKITVTDEEGHSIVHTLSVKVER